MMFGVVSDSCEAIIKVTVGRADAPKITSSDQCAR
jgi:hypothetical protein